MTTKNSIEEKFKEHKIEPELRTTDICVPMSVILSISTSQIKTLLSEILPEVEKPNLNDCDCKKGEYEAIQEIKEQIKLRGF